MRSHGLHVDPAVRGFFPYVHSHRHPAAKAIIRVTRWAALTLLVAHLPTSLASAREHSEACSSPVYSQFDFWVGEWTVIDRVSGKWVGNSHIEKLYGDCALRESWSGEKFRGGSLNGYSRIDQRWHQVWMDSSGAVRKFVGRLSPSGAMTLVARQPVPEKTGIERLIKMEFTANVDGTVRQYSTFSDDGGRSWQLRYDFQYLPLGNRLRDVERQAASVSAIKRAP